MVKFGFCVPLFAGACVRRELLGFDVVKSLAAECDRLGYDSLWAADHLMLGHGAAIMECWTVLSSLAPVTSSMRLGALVLCAGHRNPALAAKMAATLDVISGGRVDYGIGAGWHRSEQQAYGLPWIESPRERVQMMEDAIEIAREMWTKERPSYKGRHYSVEEAVCEPKPLQKPHPPIWIGGGGEKLLLRSVARYADGWNIPAMTPEAYAQKLDVIRSHCRAVGREYGEIEKSMETRILIARRDSDLDLAVEWFNAHSGFVRDSGAIRPRAEVLSDLKNLYLIGSLREVTWRMEEYVERGVQHFMLYFLDLPSTDSIKTLAEDVMPSFK